jgi:hypothetical protein
MGGPSVMVTRLGRMSSHHEGVSPSTDLSTRSMAILAESRQSHEFLLMSRHKVVIGPSFW